MQFLVVAHDCKIHGLERRLAVRDNHLKMLAELRQQKKCLYAARLEDETQKPIGSVMIFDFATREELDAMLVNEPYTQNKAWERIEVTPCVVADMFQNKD